MMTNEEAALHVLSLPDMERDRFLRELDGGKGRALTWTSERPTREGWYWYRDAYHNESIVHVQSNGLVWLHRAWDEEPAPEGLWAGPLEPPIYTRLGDVQRIDGPSLEPPR